MRLCSAGFSKYVKTVNALHPLRMSDLSHDPSSAYVKHGCHSDNPQIRHLRRTTAVVQREMLNNRLHEYIDTETPY